MAAPPCTRNFLRATLVSLLAFCRYLTICGSLRRRHTPTSARSMFSSAMRSIQGAAGRRAPRTRLPLHDRGRKSPLSRLLMCALSVLAGPLRVRLCVCALESDAQTAATHPTCTATPPPSWSDDLSARQHASTVAVGPSAHGCAHHDVVGPAVFVSPPCGRAGFYVGSVRRAGAAARFAWRGGVFGPHNVTEKVHSRTVDV